MFPSLFPVRWLISVLLTVLSLVPAATGMEQRIYVWQRAWTPAVRQAVATESASFAALDVLAAEISWREGKADLHAVTIHWPSLRTAARPVGLVVRVGPRSGDWAPDSPATAAVVAACREVLADARRNGIEPVELQLDFDAATARLAAYRLLLETVRREVEPPRLVITTLPDWLRSPEFAALVAAADCYVLQVHSLEKPRAIDDPYTLCDPAQAARWIAQASALGRPFRVALPSYGYRLIFDDTGKFHALEAEGTPRSWPPGYAQRLALADPAEIAECVQLLLASPPRACEGLVWFRFPMAGDELAWSRPTLRAVMQGRPPERRLALEVIFHPSETSDLELANSGEASVEPTAFRVEWRDARLLAADALAGW